MAPAQGALGRAGDAALLAHSERGLERQFGAEVGPAGWAEASPLLASPAAPDLRCPVLWSRRWL